MAEHSGVGVFLRHLYGVERFGERTDLVDLDQDRVADAELDAFRQKLRVSDEEVVANELRGFAELLGEDFPSIPIAFAAAVFDRNDRVFLLKTDVILNEFFS